MTVKYFFSRFIEDVDSSTSASGSMADSTSGSLEFESLGDMKSYIIKQTKAWSDIAMIDWAGSSSEEYKEFEKKLKATELLVAKIKKLPELDSSMDAFQLIVIELRKKTEEVSAFVNDTIEKSQKEGTTYAASMNLLEFLEMMTKNLTSGSGSDTASTEGSDEGSIPQKSVESTTQSSPSFQKTWDKLTGSQPVSKTSK